MRKKVDIYGYKRREDGQLALLGRRAISEKNRQLITQFYEDCVVRNISVPRRVKCLGVLQQLATLLAKDFDTAKKEDIIKLVEKIRKADYTPWTKHTKTVILKRFYKWLKAKDAEHSPTP